MKGQPAHVVSGIDDDTPEHFKPLEYPFDLAWQKVEKFKGSKKKHHQSGAHCKPEANVATEFETCVPKEEQVSG